MEVAELWHRMGFRDAVVSPEEIACEGCTASSPCRHGIAACAGERGVRHCGACSERPGCDRLAKALERTEAFATQCRGRCDPEIFAVLKAAFFRKRELLDREG